MAKNEYGEKMTLDEIRKIIEGNIPQSKAYVLDPMGDGQHLQALVISPIFAGMMLVKQHQMVMNPLKEALAGAVHALGVKTFTPEKWDQEKYQYGH
jgi:acid stress-induced BolA-like protein IbaG/YrbA